VRALTLSNTSGVGGRALANSAAVAVEVGVLLVILRRRWQGLGEAGLLATLGRTALASAAMAIGILAAGALLDAIGLAEGGLLLEVVRLGLLLVIGLAVYVIAALLLGLHEIRDVAETLLRRVRREAPSTDAA